MYQNITDNEQLQLAKLLSLQGDKHGKCIVC